MNQSTSLPPIAYILRSYPRLSQTFVLNEIWALEQLGLPIHIFAMANPHEPIVQALVEQVRATVDYLEAPKRSARLQWLAQHLLLFWLRPRRYLRTLWYVLRHAECDEGYTTASRFTCLHLAVALTHRLGCAQHPEVAIQHVHAHFAHDPTLIAHLVHQLTGLPFTFTAHARDLYQIPPTALAERVTAAKTVITCCEANLDYLHTVAPESVWPKIHLIHHGVNLHQFQPVWREAVANANPLHTPLLLSVGRLVEKKGFLDLLHACAQLKERGHCFRCLIYGEGPLADQLTALINELDLTAVVQLLGACPQEAIITMMQQSDIFVLTPYITDDGDRDGVPNVLVEAMACGLPVVTTAVGGIPELVMNQQNGLLSAPHDITTIATNLSTLLESSTLRRQLGMAARQTVEEQFDLHTAARQLLAIFVKSP